jgi:hypothetical protein
VSTSRVLEKFALAIALTAMAVNGVSLLAMGYCVFFGQWTPAIFVLLARSELVKWLDGMAERWGMAERIWKPSR